LANNELVLDAIQGGVGIGQQRAGARRNFREERVLANNELVLDAIQGGVGIGKQCAGAGRDGL
jgi:hypothetical protein